MKWLFTLSRIFLFIFLNFPVSFFFLRFPHLDCQLGQIVTNDSETCFLGIEVSVYGLLLDSLFHLSWVSNFLLNVVPYFLTLEVNSWWGLFVNVSNETSKLKWIVIREPNLIMLFGLFVCLIWGIYSDTETQVQTTSFVQDFKLVECACNGHLFWGGNSSPTATEGDCVPISVCIVMLIVKREDVAAFRGLLRAEDVLDSWSYWEKNARFWCREGDINAVVSGVH